MHILAPSGGYCLYIKRLRLIIIYSHIKDDIIKVFIFSGWWDSICVPAIHSFKFGGSILEHNIIFNVVPLMNISERS